MTEIPSWFQEAYDELSTLKEGERWNDDEERPSVEALLERFTGDLRGWMLPNPIEYEGRGIQTDPKVPPRAWVKKLLGNHAVAFPLIPARASEALDSNVTNSTVMRNRTLRQLQKPPMVVTDAWRLNSSMGNFGMKLDPAILKTYEDVFGPDWRKERLTVVKSMSCWPLRVRTNEDVQNAIRSALEKWGLTQEVESFAGMSYPNEHGGNFNVAVQRTLFPVMLDLLCQGYSLYPTLI